uniref:Major facilitator superfamily (MFS) profile domain-containing protein n=1 Tax=Ditylenchus dipsaci TaxID=166011 RepID=A0A915CMJ2_9BILA
MGYQNNDGFEFDEVSLQQQQKSEALRNNTRMSTPTRKSSIKLDKAGLTCIVILFVVNLLNYMDRYTIAGVLTDIQKYFSINDAMAGLLQTIFIVFFMIFAPLCGFLGDRYNRKILMMCAFLAFCIAERVVGIGEASYSIIAPTLIADYFISTLRSRVLMFFYFAIPVGSGLGFMTGSYVSSVFGSWKWGLRVTPVLEGQAEKAVGNGVATVNLNKEKSTYVEDIKYLCSIKTYLWSVVGSTAVVFVTGTLAWWAPTAVQHAIAMRSNLTDTNLLQNSQKESVALTFGAITCAAGVVGVSAGTVLSQAWKDGKLCFRKIKTPRADALISAIGSFLAVPLLFAGLHLLHASLLLAYISIFFAILFLCLNWAINVDMLMYIIVPQRRSIANSWLIMISHLFGDASGPYVIGLFSDWIRGPDDSPSGHYYSLLYSFYVPNILLLISGIAFILCAVALVKDMDNFNIEMGLKKSAVTLNESRSSHKNNAFSPD